MELDEFCLRLGMEQTAADLCCAFAPDLQTTHAALRLLRARPQAFAEKMRPKTPAEKLALAADMARQLEDVYSRWGISPRIYWDTFEDIALWEREFFARTGEHGLTEFDWICRHLDMRLFRLGSLQFEPLASLPAAAAGLRLEEGELLLNVHIPKGADLSEAARRDSLAQALKFWNCSSAVCLCDSWLLGPELQNLLPAGSRIKQFAAEFAILSANPESPQAVQRIFGQADPAAFLEKGSSLQRAAARHLAEGGRLSSACGWKRIAV